MTDNKKLIEEKHRELKVAGLRSKVMGFEIRLLELEDEINRLNYNKRLCEEEIEKVLTPVTTE